MSTQYRIVEVTEGNMMYYKVELKLLNLIWMEAIWYPYFNTVKEAKDCVLYVAPKRKRKVIEVFK